MVDVLDRLQKLLAMAQSPVEEEARTAALMAAKLINAHQVQFQLPKTVTPRYQPPPPAPKPTPPPPPKPKPAPPPPPKPTQQAWGFPKYGQPPITLRTTWAAQCRHCHTSIPQGVQALWLKGKGVTHTTCAAYWYKPAP